MGYTSRHLHQRVEEHKRSTIGNHVKEEHGKEPEIITSNFKILKTCQSKFDCLIFEMIFIRKLIPKVICFISSLFNIFYCILRIFIINVVIFFLIFLYCSYVNILKLFSEYLISPLTIVYKHMLILLFIMNLKMTVGRSKRRSFLRLIFLVKSVFSTTEKFKHRM